MKTTKSLVALAFASSLLAGCGAAGTMRHADVKSAAAPEVAGASTTCITVQRGVSGNVADTRVAEAWPASSYGKEPVAFVGKVGTQAREMLLRFDLAGIPEGARVTKATLTLHRMTCGCSSVNVHRAGKSWNEADATWESLGGGAGALVGTLPDATGDEDGFGPVSMDITETVRAWENGAPNDGLVFTQERANTTFETSEAANVADRPRLDVCYEASLR